MNTACGIGARKVLNHGTQNHEGGTGAPANHTIQNRLNPAVLYQRKGEHGNGGSCCGERNQARFHKALRSLACREGANHVAGGHDEHRNRNDGGVQHVGHALDQNQENLSHAPEGGKTENREAYNRVAPGGREIAHGGAHF